MNLRQLIEKFYILEEQEKLFDAEMTDEAEDQLMALEEPYKSRITTAIQTFEIIGTKYKNINKLGNGLFEIKPQDVRAYFKYHPDRRRIIIIGFVCLKKSQKAPRQNIKQAHKNIQNSLFLENKKQ